MLMLCLLPTGAAAGLIAQPELVEIDYFIGTANYPNDLLLEWQSVSEIATVLYRIRRATVNDRAQAILISPDISAHPGSTLGYTYSYQDTLNLVGGTTYDDRIQDEDINGATTTHVEPNLVPIVPWGVLLLRRVQLRSRHRGHLNHRQPMELRHRQPVLPAGL